MTMTLTLNGEATTLERGLTVAELIESLGLDPDAIAVERNLALVPRSTFANARLEEGDRVEIVHFIGGG